MLSKRKRAEAAEWAAEVAQALSVAGDSVARVHMGIAALQAAFGPGLEAPLAAKWAALAAAHPDKLERLRQEQARLAGRLAVLCQRRTKLLEDQLRQLEVGVYQLRAMLAVTDAVGATRRLAAGLVQTCKAPWQGLACPTQVAVKLRGKELRTAAAPRWDALCVVYERVPDAWVVRGPGLARFSNDAPATNTFTVQATEAVTLEPLELQPEDVHVHLTAAAPWTAPFSLVSNSFAVQVAADGPFRSLAVQYTVNAAVPAVELEVRQESSSSSAAGRLLGRWTPENAASVFCSKADAWNYLDAWTVTAAKEAAAVDDPDTARRSCVRVVLAATTFMDNTAISCMALWACATLAPHFADVLLDVGVAAVLMRWMQQFPFHNELAFLRASKVAVALVAGSRSRPAALAALEEAGVVSKFQELAAAATRGLADTRFLWFQWEDVKQLAERTLAALAPAPP